MRAAIESWKQGGNVSLWRYTENVRNFPGWHLSADTEGVSSLLALFDLLRASEVGAYRTVAITAPTAATLGVPNNRASPVISPVKWRIEHALQPGTTSTWQFPASDEPASLLIGGIYFAQMTAGLNDIARGLGDYSIGRASSGSSVLWFWWASRGT